MTNAVIIILVSVALIAGALGAWFLYPVFKPPPKIETIAVHDTVSLGWQHDTIQYPVTVKSTVLIHDTIKGVPDIHVERFTTDSTRDVALFFSLRAGKRAMSSRASVKVHTHAEFLGSPVNAFRDLSMFIDPVSLEFPDTVQTITPGVSPSLSFFKDLWLVIHGGYADSRSQEVGLMAGANHLGLGLSRVSVAGEGATMFQFAYKF